MKKQIKKIIVSFLPAFFFWQQSFRFRIRIRKKFLNFQNQIEKKLFHKNQIKVLHGPFKGLNYYNKVVWGPITPKWIGSYEAELHSVIDKLIADQKYNMIIDIGAAEGYYAVGFAHFLPKAIVHSFDIDPYARSLQKELSKINATSNLIINRSCTPQILSTLISSKPNSLIICDIEGEEYNLMDLEFTPELINSDLLIEVHPYKDLYDVPTMEGILSNRFKNSHTIERISLIDRNISDYPVVADLLTKDEFSRSVKEYRLEDQSWLWLQQKSG